MKRLLDFIKTLPRAVAVLLISIFLFVLVVYYPVGMVWVHTVDDSPDYNISEFEIEGGSHAVAAATALVDREINQHHWTPSDPFFYPGAALTRMPAFQRGIMATIARFTIELSDQIARTRGSSGVDEDVQKANGLFNYSPYVWMWDLNTSWLPTASSATQYRAGLESLMRYNQRLAKNEAVFERRADNLLEAMNRMAADLGSSSSDISHYIEGSSQSSFGSAAELFYFTKGRLYANYMILSALQKDYAVVIEERQLSNAWAKMLESLRIGMSYNHFFVLNFSPDSTLLANHLASQGFYLMRARTQMREITDILLK
ncbi:MAG: DUF2333 family protein [Rickettsiales bacterium]|jgi:hypothetical protein|nr:DUF2333 family protein [Rickettsiales bacterium]